MVKYEEGVVLLVGDLHLDEKDTSSIKNSRRAKEMFVETLIELAENNKKNENNLIMIFLGDVFNKGYTNAGMAMSHFALFERLHNALEGRLHSVIGNHFYLQRDTNPMLHLIQPNNYITPVQGYFTREKPIINIDPCVIVGCMQFSLFHWERLKAQKMYKQDIMDPCVKYHHGLYHDDNMVPNAYKGQFWQEQSDNDYIRWVFENIDMATCGHIHSPIGQITVRTNNREIPMDIPGNIVPVTIAESREHEIKLPLYIINKEGFKKTYLPLRTFNDILEFKDADRQDNDKEKLTIAQVNDKLEKYFGELKTSEDTLEGFIRASGGEERDIKLIKDSFVMQLKPKEVMSIYQEGEVI